MEAIKVENINKGFGSGDNRITVLDGVSLEIKHGEFVSLMGASGSGKSTLLYLIGGLDKADGGSIYLSGKDISSLNDKEFSKIRREKIGFVFQFYNLVQNLTVEENIVLPLLMSGKREKDFKNELEEIMQITGLSDKRKSYPRELSGGQQQRTAIARTVMINPEIILADEPTGNLDSKSSEEIMKLFARLNNEKNITILQVTHSDSIAAYGTRTLHLVDGRLEISIQK